MDCGWNSLPSITSAEGFVQNQPHIFCFTAMLHLVKKAWLTHSAAKFCCFSDWLNFYSNLERLTAWNTLLLGAVSLPLHKASLLAHFAVPLKSAWLSKRKAAVAELHYLAYSPALVEHKLRLHNVSSAAQGSFTVTRLWHTQETGSLFHLRTGCSVRQSDTKDGGRRILPTVGLRPTIPQSWQQHHNHSHATPYQHYYHFPPFLRTAQHNRMWYLFPYAIISWNSSRICLNTLCRVF